MATPPGIVTTLTNARLVLKITYEQVPHLKISNLKVINYPSA